MNRLDGSMQMRDRDRLPTVTSQRYNNNNPETSTNAKPPRARTQSTCCIAPPRARTQSTCCVAPPRARTQSTCGTLPELGKSGALHCWSCCLF
jgi:hypothetical protein